MERFKQVIDGETVPAHNYCNPSDKRSPFYFTPLSLRPNFGAKMDDFIRRSSTHSGQKDEPIMCHGQCKELQPRTYNPVKLLNSFPFKRAALIDYDYDLFLVFTC